MTEVIIRYQDDNSGEMVGKLVRCKDCVFRHDVQNLQYGSCIFVSHMVDDNDYCSCGERKEQ